jgi:hypothetical protein
MKLITRFGRSQTWPRLLALILIASMLVSPGSVGLAAADTTPVMSAESKSALVGETFDLMIYIQDVQDLSAFQFSLDYDPQIVSVLNVAYEPFLLSTGRILGGVVGPTIDPIAGTVTYGAFTTGATPPGPNAGPTPVALAKVTMQALQAGFSPANLFDLTVSNTAGVPQQAVGVNGLITVTQDPLPPALTSVIAAPNLVVGVGGDFEVTITITNSVDLAAYQFTVGYDPTIIEFVSAANSPYLESTGRTLGGLVGPSGPAGSVTFGAFTTGATPPGPTNPGMNTLAVLTFHAKQAGFTPLTLSGTLVSDTAGITRLANKIDGSVLVKRPAMRVDSTCTVSQVAGVPFTVPVLIDYAADMSAFEFTMNWNPAILQLQQVDLGGFLLSTGRTFGGIVQSGGPGALTYGAYTVGATPAGPSGSGVLAILTFMPLAAGNTVLDLEASTVSNTIGGSFTTLRTDGCVQVVNPAAAVELAKTVGTVPGVCATTDEITLPSSGGTVYYCYTITNNGNVALTEHDLVDSELGAILDGLQYNLAAGASVNTVAAGLTVSATITQTTVNTATWTASAPDLSTQLGQNVSAVDTDSAVVTVEIPTAVELSDFGAGSKSTTGVPLAAMMLALLAPAIAVGAKTLRTRQRTR